MFYFTQRRRVKCHHLFFFTTFSIIIFIFTYHHQLLQIVSQNNVSLLTTLYWKRQKVSPLDHDLAKVLTQEVNLWRPTDAFTGPWNVSYDDRILAQLLWAGNVRPTKKKRIVLPNGFAWWWHTEQTLKSHLQRACPNLANYCEYVEFSEEVDDLVNADAVLVNFDSSDFPSGKYVKAVYILESSANAHAHLNGTDLLCSYWRGSDIVTPYGKFVQYDPLVQTKEQGVNYAAGKTKMAAIFTSNCKTHNARLDYVNELQQAGLSIDIYGQCGTMICSRTNSDPCFEKLKKDYKFYLAFENSNCRDYITEKLFKNALSNNIVPVVMGANLDDYLNFAPYNSFIHIDSFNSSSQLVEYLQFLNKNDDEYNKYFEWKGTGEFIALNFFCNFCGMMHYADIVPIPVRNQSLDFEVSANEQKPKNTAPCLPRNQHHWNLIV